MGLDRKSWRPPPGWPPAPPGWSPPPGWRPDPSWPEAPEDWQFWQGARRTRTRWIVPVVVVAALGFVGLGVLGLYEYVTADNTEFLDDKVAVQADTSCTQLESALRALPPLPSTVTDQAKAARLNDQVALMRTLVADMRGLGSAALRDDNPAEGWISDWEDLAEARSQYAAQIKVGTAGATMHEPQTSDGYPISGRMKDASTDSCYPPIDELRQPLP